MNDLDLISELRPDERLAEARELAPARSLLADAIAAGDAARPARPPPPASIHAEARAWRRHSPPPAPSGPGVGWRSPAWPLAAAAAGVAGRAGRHPRRPRARGQPRPPAPPARQPLQSPRSAGHPGQASAIKPFTGRLTAARFLNAAARAALTQPATPPRPGQFVYAETEGPGGSSRYQIWQSADGSQAGLVINSPAPSR